MAKMSQFIFLVLMGIHSTAAVTHSLKYFYTGSSQVPNFPEFVAVGLVNDVQIDYYDSITQIIESKQDWNNVAVDPQHWEIQSGSCVSYQQTFKADIETAKQCFNQTEGVKIFQKMFGCEWDDETEEVTVHDQYGYNGEDWIIWDVKTNRWIAATQKAEIIANKWNNDRVGLQFRKYYLNRICTMRLKKYVDSGWSSLMRRDLPSVSFIQKNSSSPVSCHATGFYPNRAEMFWRKDGEEVHDGVVRGEILPNNDGTFQMSVDIDLSSVAPEDWKKYECVFQLSGVREDIIHRLEKTRRNPELNPESNMMIIISVVAAMALLGVIGVTGFFLYKKKNTERPPSTTYDTNTSSPETLSLTSDKSDDYQGSNPSDITLQQKENNN